MKKLDFGDLDGRDRTLVQAAAEVMLHAYAPYSSFWVGAAVRSTSGKVYRGANLENASYGVTVCAEVAALGCANSAGDLPAEAIAVVGGMASSDGQIVDTGVITPCGRCRQLIAEAGHIAGTDVRILASSPDLSQVWVASIGELLPHPFGPEFLKP